VFCLHNQQEFRSCPQNRKPSKKPPAPPCPPKRGDTAKKDLKGASKAMVESMSEKQLEDLAHTKRDKLPEKKGD